MFFSKKKKKRQKMEQSLKEFKGTVKKLVDGIYRSDELLQKMTDAREYHYNSVALVCRTLQDLTALLLIYKANYFFHPYYEFPINQMIKSISESTDDLESTGRKLAVVAKNFSITKSQLEKIDPDEFDISDKIHEVKERLLELNLIGQQCSFNIHNTYLEMRAMLCVIRAIVVHDYIAINSGIDMIEWYDYNERLCRNEISAEIRFDKTEIKKPVFKEETENE